MKLITDLNDDLVLINDDSAIVDTYYIHLSVDIVSSPSNIVVAYNDNKIMPLHSVDVLVDSKIYGSKVRIVNCCAECGSIYGKCDHKAVILKSPLISFRDAKTNETIKNFPVTRFSITGTKKNPKPFLSMQRFVYINNSDGSTGYKDDKGDFICDEEW